jgi:hypothetical protein
VDRDFGLTDEELARDLRGLAWRVFEGPGMTAADERAKAARGELGGLLGQYLDKVRTNAVEVTDAEVEALRLAGHSDDQLFELTVAASLGAALDRLSAGLVALFGAAGNAPGPAIPVAWDATEEHAADGHAAGAPSVPTRA